MAFVKEDRIAQNIIEQIGQWNMMGMGAHKIERYLDALRFKIRAQVPGKQQVRIMQVQIKYNANDLYDVQIGYMKKLDWIDVVKVDDVFAENMVEIMHRFR